MPINRKSFFDAVRPSLFNGSFNEGQVRGLDAIIDGWEERSTEFTDIRWLAYMMATAYHETARTMLPINEYGGDAYFFRMYDPQGDRPDFAKQNGNIFSGDGVLFHGRGLVQLTWRSNYFKLSQMIGLDLVADPDLALVPKYAVSIMFLGMKTGVFTGVGLGTYFNQVRDDPINARHIINGTDKASLIAGYHHEFLSALVGATS